jgi:4-amino-4-deoxy-L-arabinose transferase-like glycosyltransferase
MNRLTEWIGRGYNGLAICLILFFALVGANWVGYIGSDDVTFAHGAYGWLEEFPYVGGHGTIRYTITIPMALAFRLFGENEFAMALPGLAYLTGFFVMVWAALRKIAGPLAAFCALFLLVTSPLLVIQASIANVDVIEMFFLTASVLLFWKCLDQGPDVRRLAGAGALAGLAFLTRETAIFVAVFYGLFFLAGHRFARSRYLWIAAGFLAVWALELLYLWIMTGDPLFRINISLHHDSTIDRSVDLAGNVIAHPLIDPLLVLAINQEFMLLFFLAVPLIAWLVLGKGHNPRLQHFARVFGLLALVWFVCIAAAQKLLPLNPRYFMMTAVICCILAGAALAQLFAKGKRGQLWTGLILLALAGTNFVGIYVENKDSLFGERKLAQFARENPLEALSTDPMTRYRSDMLLRWAHAGSRVSGTRPEPGSVYFHNPANAAQANFKMPAADLARFAPQPGWQELAAYEPEPGWLAVVLEQSGIAAHLPQGIWHKLRYRHPKVTLYRAPKTL